MRRALFIAAKLSVAVLMLVTLMTAAGLLYVRSQGLLILSVQTASMRPAIKSHDVVLVKQGAATIKQLRPGMIITYHSLQNPDVTITHRIIRLDRQRGLITTKGDALDKPDPEFDANRITGVVTRTVPSAGYAFDFIRHPAGLLAAVYLPSILLVILEIRRLMRHYASQRYQVYYY